MVEHKPYICEALTSTLILPEKKKMCEKIPDELMVEDHVVEQSGIIFC